MNTTNSHPQSANAQIASQSEIIRKNISAIAEVQRKEQAALSLQERIAGRITSFSGSMRFVYIHAIWFSLWILLNVGLVHIPHINEFDPYPFGLLTLVVSLEAIFLSTFVLIAQNRLARQSERRADLDLQINLLAEQKAAKILEMLDQIAQQLDQTSRRFNYAPDAEIAQLKISPQPQEVLQVIEEAIKEEVEREAEVTAVKLEQVASDVERLKEEVSDASPVRR